MRDVLDQLLNPHSADLDIREAVVPAGSQLDGQTVEGLALQEAGSSLLALVRRGHAELAPSSGRTVAAGDVLVIVGAPEELQRFFQEHGLVDAQRRRLGAVHQHCLNLTMQRRRWWQPHWVMRQNGWRADKLMRGRA